MQSQAQAETQKLDLKVCERCGGLWLRPQESRWRYCRRCKPKVDRLPVPRPRATHAEESAQ